MDAFLDETHRDKWEAAAQSRWPSRRRTTPGKNYLFNVINSAAKNMEKIMPIDNYY